MTVTYLPIQYIAGTAAPFIIGADGPDNLLFTVLDNLIAEGKAPAMIAISIGNGGGDAQGSERGLEYDTMNGKYAELVENEILPLVESKYQVKLTKDLPVALPWAAVQAVMRAHHRMVSLGIVSPCAYLLGHLYQSAMAL